jgi:hypothetical protein
VLARKGAEELRQQREALADENKRLLQILSDATSTLAHLSVPLTETELIRTLPTRVQEL